MARPKLRPGKLAMHPKAAALKKHYRFYQLINSEPDRSDTELQHPEFPADELPVVDQFSEAAAVAQAAPPPWEREDWVPSPPYEGVPGELLKLARDRLGVTSSSAIHLMRVKVTPDREKFPAMTKLKAARKRARELGYDVCDDAFADWIGRCVVLAQRPDEWTQAKLLYESYLKHASSYGSNRGDKALSREELATETRWGKMMGAQYPNKKRRARGWYYPLKAKRGA